MSLDTFFISPWGTKYHGQTKRPRPNPGYQAGKPVDSLCGYVTNVIVDKPGSALFEQINTIKQ